MFVFDVIPLKRSVQKETLTYFSASDAAIGSIVEIPIRKKMTAGIVIGKKDLLSSKTNVKTSTFQLKKINKVQGPSIFSSTFFTACEQAAAFYSSTTGAVIDTLIPRHFFERYSELHHQEHPTQQAPERLKQEKLAMQASLEDRLSFYKTLIRESFARGQSIFICLPTIQMIDAFEESLVKGIEQYTVSLHSNLTQKEQVERYNRALQEQHPICILATGSYLFIPRDDIYTYILENESSNAYKHQQDPYLDIRTFIELLTGLIKKKLIIGDSLLRTESIWRIEQKEFTEVSPINFRIHTPAEYTILPVETDTASPFSFFTKELDELITYLKKTNKRLFLFNLRKGLATSTVCRDCQAILLCDTCDAPLVLHETKADGRFFLCTKCNTKTTSKVTCKKCSSWNLVPIGIGTDAIVEKLMSEYELPVFHVSKQVTSTARSVQKVVTAFYKEAPGILVGTEQALPYLKEPVDYTAVISLDSLFSIPSFRINERIVQLLLGLGRATKEHVLIQTRNPKDKTLHAMTQKNLNAFYRTEIEHRETLSYPPYTTLIKISQTGTPEELHRGQVLIEKLFAAYHPVTYDAFTKRVRGKHITHTLIKVPRSQWSLPALTPNGTLDEVLQQSLKSLPQPWTITVDPIDLL